MTVIRAATVADAEALAAIHHAAVHGTASACYDAAILDHWSPPADERRIASFRRALHGDEEHIVVAVVDGRVVGFASVVPAANELRAVYVHPHAGRGGIGGRLLCAIEEIAAAEGAARLDVDSSLNAEDFYRRHGYAVTERGMHELGSGASIACVRMTKRIPS